MYKTIWYALSQHSNPGMLDKAIVLLLLLVLVLVVLVMQILLNPKSLNSVMSNCSGYYYYFMYWGNFPVLACHFHKLAVTRPGLSSGKFRVRSHERLFPFPLGGWQSPALQKFPAYYPRA